MTAKLDRADRRDRLHRPPPPRRAAPARLPRPRPAAPPRRGAARGVGRGDRRHRHAPQHGGRPCAASTRSSIRPGSRTPCRAGPRTITGPSTREATLGLARAAERAGVRRFVFLSSIRAQCGPFRRAACSPRRARRAPTDAYGRSKLAAEAGPRRPRPRLGGAAPGARLRAGREGQHGGAPARSPARPGRCPSAG